MFEGLHSTLRILLDVANEVIPFDGHRVYLRSLNGDGEDVWHFHRGFIDSECETDRCRALMAEVESSKSERCRCTRTQKEWTGLSDQDKYFTSLNFDFVVCVVRFRFDSAEGFVAIARDFSRGDFSPVECRQLTSAARLLEAAVARPDGPHYQLLKRLQCFLDQRTLLQDSPSEKVLEAYIQKVAVLCHPQLFDPTHPEFDRNHNPEHTIRIDLKRVSPNHTVMRIENTFFSTNPDEWRQCPNGSDIPRHETPYLLSEENSIATRVFKTCEPVFEDDYQASELKAIRLFSDTRRHISAPIVAGHGKNECLGVLTIETTDPDAYSDVVTAAVALLAGHAFWPLDRARKREDADSKAREVIQVGVTKGEFREQATEDGIIASLQDGLEKLRYRRGFFSRVTYLNDAYDEFEICGDPERSWGGPEMQMLAGQRARISSDDRDKNDCQVDAVRTGKAVPIPNPRDDVRVHSEVQRVMDLNPFAIFPLKDRHDRVVWTLHIEREDTAPIGKTDIDLVNELCVNAMKARDDSRHSAFELQWFELLYTKGFSSRKALFEEFAAFVCDEPNRIVTRCRIYTLDGSNIQRALLQHGRHQVDGFDEMVLGDEVSALRNEIVDMQRPLLVTLPKGRWKFDQGDEFTAKRWDKDPHEDRFGERSQWLELPVDVGHRVVAKVVVDFYREPRDAFTLGEVRHLTRLVRLLSLAADTLELERDRTNLVSVGLQHRLLWHHLFINWRDLYIYCKDDEVTKQDMRSRLILSHAV